MSRMLFLYLLYLPSLLYAQTTGSLTDVRDGRVYPAVRIGSQWWMAKSLNYGLRINETVNSSDNGTVEKYCYNNNETSCSTWGAFYQWNELMNYTYTESFRGICPAGWHIPSDAEWKALEIRLGMSKADADLLYGWRGTPTGTRLKIGGKSGFEGMLAGFKNSTPAFADQNAYGYFWSSSNYNSLDSYIRILGSGHSDIGRWTYQKTDGLSVRCVKDSEGGLFSVITLDLKNSDDGSSSSWGDYDRDGDLDILYGNSRYKNNSGTFSHAGGYAAGIVESAFCNYNNDNYLDYVAIESHFPCGTSSIFKNNGSSFDSIYFDLQCSSYTRMTWGDYDNNGTKDFIVQTRFHYPLGKDQLSALLFKNVDKNGSFTDVNESIPGMYNGSVDWGDYDKDLDLDLLITGTDVNNNKETYVFRNDNGNFTNMNLSLAQISGGQAVWADYDSDGDLDIVMSGLNIHPIAKIYRNDGNNLFTDIQAGFENISGKVAVADMDNDGLNDVIFCGSGEDATKEVVIYKNEGNDSFSSYAEVSPMNEIADARPGDFDNDGDLDILVGKTLLQNNFSLSNNPPSVPDGLNTKIRANEVIFSWENSSDDKTDPAGLTYNLKVGTTPGGGDIVCPNTNGSTKKLNIPGVGNTFQNTSWKIKDLAPGTYYWSVQAIDNSFATSSFSSEATFEILEKYSEDIMISNIWNSYPGYSIDAGDYDNDGDYDLICSLFHDNPRNADTTFIFKNINATLTKVNAGLPQLKNSSALWADLNNDNQLELLLSGRTFQDVLTTDIYRKQSGDYFVPLHSGLKGLYKGSIDCMDFDNDGDQDILLTGMDLSDNYYTIIYENDAMSFTESKIALADVANGSARWADINNDDYYDIILSGQNESGNQTRIYLNDKFKSYYELESDMQPLGGKIDISDTDNDQCIDFVVTGTDSIGNCYSIVYDNNNGMIRKTENEIVGIKYGNIVFGDWDVNGRPDLLLSRINPSGDAYLYLDAGIHNSYREFSSYYFGWSASFIDYDSDNDLDLFIAGYDGNQFGKMALVKNNYYSFNTPPSVPANLSAEQERYGVQLKWDASTDFESTEGGLTYNIRIGTISGGCDIVSPMSGVDGKLRKPKMGNTQLNTSWIIQDLPIGKYYWSVQAVDQSFVGGAWAAEQIIDVSRITVDFSTDSACLGDSTQFTDLSEITDGSITAWKWYFGDGDSSSIRNPGHLYDQAGDYQVTLMAYSGDYKQSKTKPIFVRYNAVAGFTSNTVCVGEKTHFVNYSTTGSIEIANWIWNFGDGDVSDVRDDVDHPYLDPGTYEVQLRIMATNGCEDSLIHQVIVGRKPNARIGLDSGRTELCTGDKCRLSVEYDSNFGYQWKRNGVNLMKDTISYLEVHDEGRYSVTITNRLGNCDTTSDAISVSLLETPPQVIIEAETDTICQGDSVLLEVPFNANYSYQWRDISGVIPNATSNTLYAKKEGSYTVEVSNGSCATTSKPRQVVYKSLLPKPRLYAYGPDYWFFVCDIRNAETYRWFYNENLVAENGYNQFYAGTNYGEYYVKVYDGGECYVPSNKVMITLPSTGIGPVNTENGFFLYPNPARDNLRIFYSGPNTGRILIRIMNAEGGIVKEQESWKWAADFSENIDVSGLKPGIFIMELRPDQVLLKTRFIIY